MATTTTGRAREQRARRRARRLGFRVVEPRGWSDSRLDLVVGYHDPYFVTNENGGLLSHEDGMTLEQREEWLELEETFA